MVDITGIHNVINKFQESESKLEHDVKEATVSGSLFTLGAGILSPSALMLLGKGSSGQGTESKKGFNSDNKSEDGLSFWDKAVGAKVTSGLVASADRKRAIDIEKEYGTGSKISPNQHSNNLKDMGKKHYERRNLLRDIPKEDRNIEKAIPKDKMLGKGLGVVTLALTGLTVVDDFDNNRTTPQKLEASSVDVGMTGVAYGISTGAVALVGGICTVVAAPAVVTGALTILAVGIVGIGANYATSEIKSAWNLR
ncbi:MULTISPECIES: hypothetical protein [Clostridium]|uniref:Type IV secretion protein Rhs n=1 Tax=Clostridium frigoriphilum TaxID=443253 RepID=A0ABU7UXC2_9CLOT|nr:hypothetical protein [Clostridium sp. DSM 17811]MBU3102232.1 hypothetical protein [Clostridium sp. DSM 17811]